MQRVVKRDFIERGKSKYLAQRDFIKAWEIFHKNKKKTNSINYKKKFTISDKTNIEKLIKKIATFVN